MEEFALKLQEALANQVGVFHGSEELVKQPRLPHVVVVPTQETLSPPPPTARQIAGEAALEVDLNCRAETYQDARALALDIWQRLVSSSDPEVRIRQEARIRYGTDTWGPGRTARVAQLTVTLPAPVARQDMSLAHVEFIGQHTRYEVLTFQEVSDDPQKTPGTGTVRSDFHEHADPRHRFGPDE